MRPGTPAMDADTLLFLDGHPGALPLLEAFEAMLRAEFPGTGKRVRKTQISYRDSCVFACVSFLRPKRKRDLPDPYLTVTLCLPDPLASGRAAAQTEPYPGRTTVHIVIGRPDEIDAKLISWVRRAHAFSASRLLRFRM